METKKQCKAYQKFEKDDGMFDMVCCVLNRFMKLVKGRIRSDGTMEENLVPATRKALRNVYGLSPLTLDERWKEWVKENYPTR